MSMSGIFSYEHELPRHTPGPCDLNQPAPHPATQEGSFCSLTSMDIEQMHAELLNAAAEVEDIPMMELDTRNPEDLFDNSFIPTQLVAFIESDFTPEDYMSAWVNEQDGRTVCPRDINAPLPPRRKFPTLDQFLDRWESDTETSSNSGTEDTTPPSSPQRTSVPLPKHAPYSTLVNGLSRSSRLSRHDGYYNSTTEKPKTHQPLATGTPKKMTIGTSVLKRQDAPIIDSRKKVTSERKTTSRDKKIASAERHKRRTAPCQPIRCPKGCSQICRTEGDMRRHLQSEKHRKPSVPCPRPGCPNVYTRIDAANRHARNCKGGVVA